MAILDQITDEVHALVKGLLEKPFHLEQFKKDVAGIDGNKKQQFNELFLEKLDEKLKEMSDYDFMLEGLSTAWKKASKEIIQEEKQAFSDKSKATDLEFISFMRTVLRNAEKDFVSGVQAKAHAKTAERSFLGFQLPSMPKIPNPLNLFASSSVVAQKQPEIKSVLPPEDKTPSVTGLGTSVSTGSLSTASTETKTPSNSPSDSPRSVTPVSEMDENDGKGKSRKIEEEDIKLFSDSDSDSDSDINDSEDKFLTPKSSRSSSSSVPPVLPAATPAPAKTSWFSGITSTISNVVGGVAKAIDNGVSNIVSYAVPEEGVPVSGNKPEPVPVQSSSSSSSSLKPVVVMNSNANFDRVIQYYAEANPLLPNRDVSMFDRNKRRVLDVDNNRSLVQSIEVNIDNKLAYTVSRNAEVGTDYDPVDLSDKALEDMCDDAVAAADDGQEFAISGDNEGKLQAALKKAIDKWGNSKNKEKTLTFIIEGTEGKVMPTSVSSSTPSTASATSSVSSSSSSSIPMLLTEEQKYEQQLKNYDHDKYEYDKECAQLQLSYQTLLNNPDIIVSQESKDLMSELELKLRGQYVALSRENLAIVATQNRLGMPIVPPQKPGTLPHKPAENTWLQSLFIGTLIGVGCAVGLYLGAWSLPFVAVGGVVAAGVAYGALRIYEKVIDMLDHLNKKVLPDLDVTLKNTNESTLKNVDVNLDKVNKTILPPIQEILADMHKHALPKQELDKKPLDDHRTLGEKLSHLMGAPASYMFGPKKAEEIKEKGVANATIFVPLWNAMSTASDFLLGKPGPKSEPKSDESTPSSTPSSAVTKDDSKSKEISSPDSPSSSSTSLKK